MTITSEEETSDNAQAHPAANDVINHHGEEPAIQNGHISAHKHDTPQSPVIRRKPDDTQADGVHTTKNARNQNYTLNLSPLLGFSVTVIGSFMLLWAPTTVAFFCLACHSHQCSVASLGREILGKIYEGTFTNFAWQTIPDVTSEAIILYFGWMLLQVFLYLTLPGRIRRGTATPAGNVLAYKCNGISAWVVSHILFVILVKMDFIKATIISDNWVALMVIANVFGFGLTMFSYVKAHYFPTHPEDRCFSGSTFYDFYMGIEHNPRIGPFDFKLFFNGRPGIVAWTLINLSFAAKQYNDFGYVTNSMILVNILQGMYVIDFFLNESWYLRTIDIAHDHFGFYLAWGDTVWLPFMYTLQSVYLARNPVSLPWWGFAGTLLLGLTGYWIFRSVNHQKDYFRVAMKTTGKCTIWGKPARYVLASYATTDAEQKQSYLLASGWWGLSRHFNYVGDLLNALSYCLACGFGHVLPYFYFFFMLVLLIHRSFRDDVRCKQKYGASWDKYCRMVPYRIVPYVF